MNDLQDDNLEKSISTEKISYKIKHDDDSQKASDKNTIDISKNDTDISYNVNTDIPNTDDSVKITRKYTKKPRSEKQLKQLEKSRLKYQAMAKEKKEKKAKDYENLIREKIYKELNLSDEERIKLSDKEKPVSVNTAQRLERSDIEKPDKTKQSLDDNVVKRSDIDDFDNFLKNYEKLKNIKNMILDEEMKKSNFNDNDNNDNKKCDFKETKKDFNDMIFNSRYNFNRRF